MDLTLKRAHATEIGMETTVCCMCVTSAFSGFVFVQVSPLQRKTEDTTNQILCVAHNIVIIVKNQTAESISVKLKNKQQLQQQEDARLHRLLPISESAIRHIHPLP